MGTTKGRERALNFTASSPRAIKCHDILYKEKILFYSNS